MTEVSKEARRSQKSLPLVDMKYHHWRVIRDGSLECEQWVDEDEVLQNYLWSDVEVASAVFKCAPPAADSWIEVSLDQKAQLERVCKVLTETLRIRISNTCGLHVHVGLGGEPIPPDTVRRFMTTMWLIEDAVLTLCAPWREGNRVVAPITQESLLALDGGLEFLKEWCAEVPPPHLRNMDIHHKLWDRMSTHDQRRVWVIWTLPVGQLRVATSTPHFTRGGVAIRIPDDAEEDRTTTIEIRYASSTLDAKELTSWTNIFLRLFQLCHFYDWAHSAKLMNLIEGVTDALLLSKLNKKRFPTGDAHAGHELLKLLDLGNDIPVWENAQKRWAREDNHHHVRFGYGESGTRGIHGAAR
ncbi:hypothetical protein GE09DRAFT_477757 [Coniochaeta sp. 2T2.1]|nr:hypothetical protein GE09DRAFT_477757 [Coniochaeta sp. 2T2.1]